MAACSIRRSGGRSVCCGFSVLSFAGPGAMDVAYIQVPRRPPWLEDGEGAAEHDELFEGIAQQARSESDSRAFIRHLSQGL
ncbi:Scr1 family TA system antitoxin-like transcriptional regulator [Streptomyces halobius]|uniref:Scr1 family TA system antitoxin-like transcriptional regulator n=1 Tax=Streptomyces halobius TaxID=2879846 RepID=A0ABY4MFI2_9ACTN|nr:Scr1 family TA system antitoxin-like transcriptional regulator [Streptomyces halobius]